MSEPLLSIVIRARKALSHKAAAAAAGEGGSGVAGEMQRLNVSRRKRTVTRCRISERLQANNVQRELCAPLSGSMLYSSANVVGGASLAETGTASGASTAKRVNSN